ncbi:MAG: MBOAT family protein [Gemmataceae bacterium]
MLFCTREYLFFFVAIFSVYWLIPWHRSRVFLLLGASYYFYTCWNHWLAALIAGTTVLDYFIARGMDATSSVARRRALLVLSLVVNIGLLAYFKYANFFLQSLRESLAAAGISANLPLLSVILPVGISFYTFEAINYTVDVYRRKIAAERDLPSFMLFVLFFPHLVAGPIVRASDFLPQIRRRKRWDWARIHVGIQFILLGLFKKMAIADHMAQYADPVFADPLAFKTSAVWMAVIAYSVQIYCDFSGYSDLALGSAHLLGFHLAKNFDMPYIAANVSEFWRRWHISLSTWLRDYLFIPLGGSRGSDWQTCRNLLVTMVLGGLWHGASWNFVVWGALHGLLLIVHRSFRSWCEGRLEVSRLLETSAGWSLRVATTFAVVTAGWVFFRATTFTAAGHIFARLVQPIPGLKGPPLQGLSLWVLLIVLLVAHAAVASGIWRRISMRAPAPALGIAYAVVLNLTLLLTPDGGKTFIYFQF